MLAHKAHSSLDVNRIVSLNLTVGGTEGCTLQTFTCLRPNKMLACCSF